MTIAKKRATLKDVAKKAAVSVSTASRALNGYGYASASVQQRVRKIARELGYTPHAAARSLKLQRTCTVGLIIADIANPFYSFLADGVLDRARPLGYHVILCATNEDAQLEREYLQVLLQERVDGIIAVPTGNNLELWRQAMAEGTRLVLVDREINGITTDVILVDNVRGAYDAVSYLIHLGHIRIGIISGPRVTTTGEGRLQGYYQALQEAHLPVDPALVRVTSFKRVSGFEALDALLALDAPPTAIFAANNVLGEAALFGIRERGLGIPDDISLLLFDDVPWASLTTPRITLVSQPARTLGVAALERLVQGLQAGDKILPQRIVLQPELLIRESCAPPKKGRKNLSLEVESGQTTPVQIVAD